MSQTPEPFFTPAPDPDHEVPSPATPPKKAQRSRVSLASVLAVSVLAGGGAGVGGAAAWDAWHPDEPATATTTQSQPASSTAVSDEPDAEAPGTSSGSSATSSLDTQAVAAEVLPSVVRIDVAGAQGSGSGSGIVLTADGRILTNNHVVESASSGDATVQVSFADGTTVDAKVVGTDPMTDIAVLQAQGVSDLTPAKIGESNGLAVGQAVVAIGSPYGLDATVTSGIVSALDRPVNVGADTNGNVTAYPAVQTDAAINPGNSGGPLVDDQGRVIGINASIRSTGTTSGQAGSIGLGFAIPIDEAIPIVDQIMAGETPTHARLGVTLAPVTQQTGAPAVNGAALAEVTTGSAADDSGLESGDVVTAIDDRPINDADGLIAIVRSYRPDATVTLTYTRDSQEQTTEVTLGSDAGSARS